MNEYWPIINSSSYFIHVLFVFTYLFWLLLQDPIHCTILYLVSMSPEILFGSGSFSETLIFDDLDSFEECWSGIL